MLIVGAKGFAKEVLEIIYQNGANEKICFYDDVSHDSPTMLYSKFRVLKSELEAKIYFKESGSQFTLGIGNPKLRFKLFEKFEALGGYFESTISKQAEIGSFGVEIDPGCNILSGVRISNDVTIGIGTMIYYNSIIAHDVQIGNFCELSPGVTLLGRCKLGDFVQVGAGSIIFPDVEIGSNSIIAAGAVVRENIPENVMVAGVPAVIKRNL
ncbi:acetyltransferase [Flavobacterium sp. FZUC8N2.13]|uniref:Acetyltransferase n=1 Tax=Flavobacterium zubiriense TaxID=3138075 RepID=A0ABV4T747_9FLAO